MRQLAKTVATVRKHACDWGVAREKVLVVGFSAGAHLAASLGCLHSFCDQKDSVPNAFCLCYPVVTSGEFAHRPSFDALCAEDQQRRELFSLERQVPEDLAPCFLWHTADDSTVPVENAMLFALALSQKKVSFELHIFPHGKHGSAMCTPETGDDLPEAAHWFPCLIRWAENVFKFPFSGTF